MSAALALALLLAAPPAPADDLTATRAVAAVLDDWHDAAAKADAPRYFGHFTADAVFLGTDASERWTVGEFRKFAQPYFDKGKAWSFRATKRSVMFSKDGAIAWFDEALDTPNMGPCRGSGVLVREDGRWKIAHYNLTLTIPNEKMKDVKALIEKASASGK